MQVRRRLRGQTARLPAAIPFVVVPEGLGLGVDAAGHLHRRPACRPQGVPREGAGGRRPRAQSRHRAARDQSDQRWPLRTGPARPRGHVRHTFRVVPALGDLPVWRSASRMIAEPTRRLSSEQAAAAHAGPEGAFLIAAGPGTGKTATTTERFCWLVGHRVPAGQILAVTFNDRAADELRSRITEELGARRPDLGPEVLDGAWIGTFHGVCSRLLDEFAYLVGAPRELRVLEETGQRLFGQRLVARLRSGEAAPLDPDSFTALGVDDLDDLLRSGLRFLLKLKGRGITPERFHKRAIELHAEHWGNPSDATARQAAHAELEAIEVLHLVYRTYEEALTSEGLRDFDDLILDVI